MQLAIDELGSADLLQHEKDLWAKYADEEYPDVFSFLELAKDGGFSEVPDLYGHSRWPSAILLVLFVVYNIISVLQMDLAFIQNPDQAVAALGGDRDVINGAFYFSRTFVPSVTSGVSLITGRELKQPEPVQVLGMLELLLISFYLIDLLYSIGEVVFHKERKRWYAVSLIFWDILPCMSTVSAMKMLNHIVPSIVSVRSLEALNKFQENRSKGAFLLLAMRPMLQLCFVMFFAFIAGFDTFLMKLRVVSAVVARPELNQRTFLPCIQFLIQVLGIVQLGPFIRKRLFVFIFGGEDGILQQHEIDLMNTWNALLARRMYRDLSFYQFIITMLSFSDEDFQGLVLNETTTSDDNGAPSQNSGNGLPLLKCNAQNGFSPFTPRTLYQRPTPRDIVDSEWV